MYRISCHKLQPRPRFLHYDHSNIPRLQISTSRFRNATCPSTRSSRPLSTISSRPRSVIRYSFIVFSNMTRKMKHHSTRPIQNTHDQATLRRKQWISPFCKPAAAFILVGAEHTYTPSVQSWTFDGTLFKLCYSSPGTISIKFYSSRTNPVKQANFPIIQKPTISPP